MTAIKPPGGIGGVGGPSNPDATRDVSKTTGPSFQDRVAEKQSVSTAGNVDPSHAVITDLRGGKITPNQAVQKLTDLAVQRSHAPPSVRPAVEARMRELLRSDPLVQDLMRQMGASLEADK